MAQRDGSAHPTTMGSERLEFFSDGILAIAITLLVIEIRIPSVPGAQLGGALRQLWPAYLAYALSFCTIGLVWLAHHSMFRRIGSVDRLLSMINLLLMLCVAFLPFSTAVLARYSWSSSGGSSVAVELYSLNMVAIGLVFLAMWSYLAFHLWLFEQEVERRAVMSSVRISAVIPVAYALTSGLAYVSTGACFAIWIVITIYIAIGPAARRIVPTRQHPDEPRPSEAGTSEA